MWELNDKEAWTPKNGYFQTVVLEKTLESPLDSKEIKPVNPKENQSWIFTGRTDSWSSNALATWCEEPIHWKRPWCWERLKARGEGDDSMRQVDDIKDSMDMNLSEFQEVVKDASVHVAAESQTWLSDWKTTKPRVQK